jgi:threonine-phosphate decarboxylase
VRAVHGGNVDAAARRLGRPARALLDLSANINPGGPPEGVRVALRAAAGRIAALERYPDPAYPELRAALARAADVDPAALAVGNGSAALIGAAVRALAPRCCILPVPSFSEYRKALRDAHVPTRTFALAPPAFTLDLERLAARVLRTHADLVILGNPNNPTGVVLPRAALRRYLARTPQTITIVDEAFIDYVPDASLIPGVRPRNLIVVRSLTKFYALPGVRAGYAVARPALAARIEAMLPSWPVGALDAVLAAAALGDTAYEERTRIDNERARRRLAADLHALGIATVPGAANFLLCDAGRRWRGTASALAERLARDAGVLVRAFAADPVLGRGCWIRVAVRSRRESRRLLAALAAVAAR